MRRTSIVPAVAVLLLGVGLSQAGEDGRPSLARTSGELAKVDATSLTILQRGDSGAREQTIALDKSTKVLVETAEDEEVAGEGGKTRRIPKKIEGNLGDLKVGQRVVVTHKEGVATQVLVQRPPAPKVGKEG